MDRNLLMRIATGVVGLPVVLFALYRGGWLFTLLVGGIVLISSWEWWRFARPATNYWDLALAAVGAIGAYQGAIDPRPDRIAIFLALFLVVVLLSQLHRRDGLGLRTTGHLLVGILYVGLLPAFLVRMRADGLGREAVFAAYFAAFLGDSAAYFGGRAIRGKKLWPRISPNKTWSGALCGAAGALAGAFAGNEVVAGELPAAALVGFGLCVGTLGQLGDLVESFVKREAGVKDSSALMPGHGGLLDRFDSLHFVAPVLYTYLALFMK